MLVVTASTLETDARHAGRTELAPRIGPNAIIQMGAALRLHLGEAAAAELFDRAHLGGVLDRPPVTMVEQGAVADLFHVVSISLPASVASAVAVEAGGRTADYILANRIPRFAQLVLRALPQALALRLLLKAIRQHAWTFAGSGQVAVAAAPVPRIVINGNPLATPNCPWHVAVFERLFRQLVTPRARVSHPLCSALGADACHFQIRIHPDRQEPFVAIK